MSKVAVQYSIDIGVVPSTSDNDVVRDVASEDGNMLTFWFDGTRRVAAKHPEKTKTNENKRK